MWRRLVDAGLLTLTAGRPCEEVDEIVLDAALAEGLDKHIDDEVIMFARRSIRRMTVVGIADSQSLKWFAEGEVWWSTSSRWRRCRMPSDWWTVSAW